MKRCSKRENRLDIALIIAWLALVVFAVIAS
jgi:hypothetical protein